MTVHNIASASGHGTMVGVSTFIPSTPLALAEQIATLTGSFPSVAVVAIDGPDCAQPSRLAELVRAAVESQQQAECCCVTARLRAGRLRCDTSSVTRMR